MERQTGDVPGREEPTIRGCSSQPHGHPLYSDSKQSDHNADGRHTGKPKSKIETRLSGLVDAFWMMVAVFIAIGIFVFPITFLGIGVVKLWRLFM